MENTMTPAKKIHPHKFAMWVAIGSISMMFAGLTSAYIVRHAQGNWVYYALPSLFTYSTFCIIASSLTMILALRSFKKGMVARSQNMILVTLLLGIAFGILQYMGFKALYAQDIRVDGNPSESFLFIIAGLHLLHILGGIVALFIVFIRNKIKGLNNKNATGLEVIAAYWHFVDLLWIYLFSFFLLNQ